MKCLKCRGDHWLVKCPTASDSEKKELMKIARLSKKDKQQESKCTVNNSAVLLAYCLDSGAQCSCISAAIGVQTTTEAVVAVEASGTDVYQPHTGDDVRG